MHKWVNFGCLSTQHINCRSIDVFDIELPQGWISVWFDDEFWLKTGVFPMWKLNNFQEPIIGNLIITGIPDNGDTTDVPEWFTSEQLITDLRFVRLNLPD